VGVAVSGGADSVALLRLLLELRAELGIVLSLVHLNHSLRGEESDGDEQFVRELAHRHDLVFFSERRDVKTYAAQKKLSIEAAASEIRYEYFEDVMRRGNLNKLATAHTLDDQAETVLLKLVRGAGTRGIAGIYPAVRVESGQNGSAIIRPLLGIQRDEIEKYLAQIKQPWREDSSNAELRHTRNRIRHEILPLLCEHVNPQARQALSEAAEIARAEEDSWDAESQRRLSLVWSPTESGGSLRCEAMATLSLAFQRRLVRTAAESLGLTLDFNHVEEVLGLAERGGQTALPQGWSTHHQKGMVRFKKSGRVPLEDYEYALAVPGRVVISQADLVLATFLPGSNEQSSVYNPEQLLDARFADHLVVRNWRAGDRFWPAHTKQPKKIKEILQDRHITGDEKKSWPVIASGGEVIWLRGFGVRCDLRAENGEGVLISEEPLEKND
jgi:tRNA(Ile)-lysidine synthase